MLATFDSFQRLRPLLTVFWLISLAATVRAQSGGYEDVVIVSHHVWGLTASGRIKVYDSAGTEAKVPSLNDITAKLITSRDNDVVAQIGTQIQRWSSADSTWRPIGKLSTNAFALVINSKGSLFAINEKSVLEVSTGKIYFPSSSPNNQLTKLTGFEKPATYFLDRDDNLWIGFGYGEWGGNIFTFDTQHRKFIDLTFNNFQINLHPIKSFFQLKSNVGVSSGLQHMMNSGAIAEFDEFSARTIYDTWLSRDTSTTQRFSDGNRIPYIGPAVYFPKSDYIYFYSSLGVFRGQYASELRTFTSWKKLFEPKLHWRSGQRDAVGSPMNVLKMLPLDDDKLILLTQNDGMGLWDGSSFKLLP